MGLKTPNFSGLGAKSINVGTIESQDATSVQVNLGSDAGDDFIVDTTKLVVEGDSGNVGIGTAAPTSSLEIESSSGDLILEMDNNAGNSANFQIQNGAGNARVDLVVDGNNHITMKGQRVGIVSTNPQKTLDVTGDGRVTTDLTVGGKVTSDGTLFLKERLDGDVDTADYGQLWVKNVTPCELYFTTDAGNDIQITNNTVIAGGGTAANDGNLILHMQVFS